MSDTMPNSSDLERAVLGAMLLDATAVEKAVELIDETTFYRPQHAMVFKAIHHLFMQGSRIDLLIVEEMLKEQKHLDDIGGEPFLLGLQGETRSTANVRYHCELLIDKAQKRRAILLGKQLIHQAESEDDYAVDLLMAAGQEIEKIIATSKTKTYQPLANIVPGSYRLIEQRANSKTGLTGITTGFARLNKYTSGWQKDDLIIIAAPPSAGKTSIALNHAVAAAKAGSAVGILSLEMSSEKLGERMIADKSSIAVSELHYNKPSPEDWETLANSAAYVSNLPIFIDETPALNINDITIRAKRMRREQGIELLILDHLQEGSGIGEENRRLQIDGLIHGMKTIAKSLHIPVIVVSQLSRGSDKEKRRPVKSDLRESGTIEQVADVILFIWDPPEKDKQSMADAQKVCTVGLDWENLREVFIDKQRQGPCKGMLVRWRGNVYRFEELSE
jgi:replicative DNA helicase